jgi:ribosomal protein L16 Arg81 hydroxylase
MTLLADRGRAAPSARPFLDLSRLIHPMDVVTFQRDHWEKQYVVLQRNQPDYFADLLTLDGVDQALSASGVLLDHLRVVLNGKETPVSELSAEGRNGGTNSPEVLLEHYRNGSTIVLNSLNQRWEPLRRFSWGLGADMSSRIQMNVYLTPAGAQGFVPHYDMHDVFVIQVHGTKHWRLSRPPRELPLQHQPYDKSQPPPEVDDEFDLQVGDTLYMPRGTVHSATSNETASVHVTIGIHPVLYSQAIEGAIKRLTEQDIRFRRGFPIGFVNDEDRQRQATETLTELLDALRSSLSPDEIVADSVRTATSINAPTLRHHLTDLERLDQVDVNTHVWRRPGLRWQLTATDDVVDLHFHNKTMHLPAFVADELRYVAGTNGEGFTGAAIPGDLDEPSRVVLLQSLLREGFLTLG